MSTRRSVATGVIQWRAWRLLTIVVLHPLLFGLSTGCDALFRLDDIHVVPTPAPIPPKRDNNNAYDCACDCKKGGTTVLTIVSTACMPTDLNPNLPPTPGPTPTSDQLKTDCQTRVQNNVQQMTQKCVNSAAVCTCNPAAATFAEECNGTCTDAGCDGTCPDTDGDGIPGENLKADCSNFNPKTHMKTATNVAGQPPVCLVASSDPPDPVPDPLAAGIFGQRSECDVEGTVTVVRGDSQSQNASGVVQFSGAPCPGQSCPVGMSYRLDHVDNFSFDAFGGFDRVEIKDIIATGATIPAGATVDTSGMGTFAVGSTQTSGKGTRSNQLCVPDTDLCVETSSDHGGYFGTNTVPISIFVDWQNHLCGVSGTVLGSTEGSDTSVAIDLAGTIVNEPPTADAGMDARVECTSSAGVQITLDATGSTDPENNIGLYVWRKDTRAGDEVGSDAIINLDQGLGATTYFLKVVDAYGQADEDSTVVTVVDTTPPTITQVAATPNVLRPPDHKMVPVTVTASATDTCGTATCRITAVSSNEPINGLGDGDQTPDWEITGPLTVNLREERSGKGTGRLYTITVTCSDGSGNSATGTTAVTVPR
jgi:hypothetical protein